MHRPRRSDRVGQANANDVSGARRIRRNPSGGRSAETRMNADAKSVAESVFRKESGRIIATLIRISGSFDRAEEAMQDAFASALASWPETGLPQNPGAWIAAAAHRKLIDQSRREKTRREKQDSLHYEAQMRSVS